MNEANVAVARPLSQFLRLAVIAGVESAVQIHIERGDDLNARDARGMTPLMLSAARDKPAICKLLLSAGADHRLLAPSGKTALEIAVAAGSEATAAILKAVPAPIPPLSVIALDSGSDSAVEPFPPLQPVAAQTTLAEHTEDPEPSTPETLAESSASKSACAAIVVNETDDGGGDLSGWEAEEEPTRPETDLKVLDSASAVQTAITVHEPIDSSTEWDDIDAYLPEAALPLARADDAEGRAQLRRLFLRAIREGSVPSLDVQALSTNEDRSVNSQAEAYLAMVINDLGAELDERFEYSNADESFGVFIDPEETSNEEATLDEALAAIDRAASSRHDPLQIYQREFQRLPLLTAEQEIQLGKDMEAALDDALDALAEWPDGIALTLAAGAEAIVGSRPLSSIWVGGAESDPEPASAEGLEASALEVEVPANIADEDGESEEGATVDSGDAAFADALRRLAALLEADAVPKVSSHEIRQALAALRLNRRFLLELIDAAHRSAPCLGFRRAMTSFRNARDRMAAANLKLAFFHAKKYLYSGEPLDDLAQEGNIGLLKAVDRYDWRRGFRFSTYATWWIRQQIGRYIADKVRTVRIPVHVHEKIQRMERVAQTFETAANREPTPDELAELMAMPYHKLVALQRIAPDASYIDDLTIDDMSAVDVYSLPDPADAVGEKQLNRAVDRFVSSLSAKDHKQELILRMRFGIGVHEALTLEEIGTRFELTRERIRQIEAKAIKRLRHRTQSEPFARQVLGMKPEENLLVSGALDPTEANALGAADAAPQRELIQRAGSMKPTALDQVLMQAGKLGISVDDGRETASGRIWVSLVATPDNLHRSLARKLTACGFEHWPGKGYWK
ncbi:sigma-70 family RNA polymerase sigma factor [Achromobacter denitrificans]|uniref:sigma-70 family RNA polymerase sigma factor n=1 Tax=Achromobacter denitrificans TaxID=32002 RepID=UPI000F68C4D3|nr:sigma-70 family RNA polymerase sigma factor [Achromobacter denitrificans]RSE90425.1 sigma-70 family RNA polymerase sigma factor [Achromobacter denitrificans]